MRSSEIGGQAVIEGVMMKNKDKYAVAVRKNDGSIVVDVKETGKSRTGLLKAPIIRGVVAFIDSMVIGFKTISYSATFFDEEEDTKKKVKKEETSEIDTSMDIEGKAEEVQTTEFIEKSVVTSSEKEKETGNGDKLLIAGTVTLSIILSVAIFMLLPMFLSRLLSSVIDSRFLLRLIEGGLRILIFVVYVVAISQMKDIKRVFSYHGAEHKAINCIENGYDLTVENVRKQKRLHKRCGTSFLFFVIFVSLIFFLFINVEQVWLQALIRVLLIPVIAGVSYELIRFAGKHDSGLVAIISKPGFLLQNMTTREPDDSMIEVAITSVEAVFQWKPFVEEVKAEQLAEAEKKAELLQQNEQKLDSTGAELAATTEVDTGSAEEEQQKAEAERRKKEAAQLKAEAERRKKEAAQLKAEAERQKKEAAQLKAEAERQKKEAEQQKAEEERRKAEAERQKKEAAQLKAEAERRKAEAERQKKEAAQQKAEEERRKAEAERQKAEEERQKAEEERQKAEEERQKEEERKKAEARNVNLESLDKVLKVGKRPQKLQFKDPLLEREVPTLTIPEEDDEILKALDKYFVFDDKDE